MSTLPFSDNKTIGNDLLLLPKRNVTNSKDVNLYYSNVYPSTLTNKQLLILLLAIIIIENLLMVKYTYCGTSSIDTYITELATYIEHASQEQLRDLNQFVENLRQPQTAREFLDNDNIAVQRDRFGWESLALFIGLSIVGFTLIRYGPDIWEHLRVLSGEVAMNTGEIFRNTVKHNVLEVTNNPQHVYAMIWHIRNNN